MPDLDQTIEAWFDESPAWRRVEGGPFDGHWLDLRALPGDMRPVLPLDLAAAREMAYEWSHRHGYVVPPITDPDEIPAVDPRYRQEGRDPLPRGTGQPLTFWTRRDA